MSQHMGAKKRQAVLPRWIRQIKAVGEESHSHGAAQGPGHKSSKTCAKPEAAVNSRQKTAPKQAAAGNKSILSFYKKRDHMESASAGETEQVTQDGRVEQQSRPAEKDCQTAQCAENAVQANCEADKQQNDTGSIKQPTRKRTKLIEDEQLQTARCWSMPVLTHNLMGTTTMLQETELNATELEPDVMVFTETKFTDETKKLLDAPLAQYKLYHSCKSYMKPSGRRHQVERSRAGSAGLTTAVKNTFLMQASVTPVRIDDTAAKGPL